MSISIKKISPKTQHEADNEQIPVSGNTLELLGHVNINCTATLGSFDMSIAELRQLKHGQVIQLSQKTSDKIDIMVNQKVIARGELVCCDDYFGVKITDITL